MIDNHYKPYNHRINRILDAGKIYNYEIYGILNSVIFTIRY